MVDPTTAPVFSVLIEWGSFGILDNNANPVNLGPIPVDPTFPNRPPYTPYIAPQPVIAYNYTTTDVWDLVMNATITWISDGAFWHGFVNPTLSFTVGSNGGTPKSLQISDPRFSRGGVTVLEFDNATHAMRMWVTESFSVDDTVFVGEFTGLGSNRPGGFDPAQFAGGGNIGAYYWSFYVHLYGYVSAMAIIAKSAADTVELLRSKTILPGTGPVQAHASFRAAEETPTKSVPSRLGEYAHYWPLDDAAPGPMRDLVTGALLSVTSPATATFQVPGAVDQGGHSKGIRLGGPSTTPLPSTLAYVNSARAQLGVGGVGHDLTIAFLLKWEGPIGYPYSIAQLFSSSSVSSGGRFPVQETAIAAQIGPAVAEPFGVFFQVWDSVALTFHSVKTVGFDWPAGFTTGGPPPGHFLKVPVWALATFVYRTNEAGTSCSLEIWVDGVLLAEGDVGPHGWGADVYLAQVGSVLAGSMQNLTTWPFALTPEEISGISR